MQFKPISFLISLVSGAALKEASLKEMDRKLGNCHGVEIRELTISEAHSYFTLGVLTPLQLTRCYLKRIEIMNPTLNAVIEVNPEAETIASRLPAEMGALSLYGIPILLKDNIGTLDRMNTSTGNSFLVGARPKEDAEVVRLLRKAGAVILGKANLSEMSGLLGSGIPDGYSIRGGQTRNPYNKDFQVFGSSSGSAVAVSANLAMAAIGTETDGSIMFPALISSVTAFKPSFTSISNQGIIPLSLKKDTAGALTRSVQDNIKVSRAITNANFKSQVYKPDNALRVGVVSSSATGMSIAKALERLSKSGIALVDGLHIDDIEELQEMNLQTVAYEFKRDFKKYLETQTIHFPSSNLPTVDSIGTLIQLEQATNLTRSLDYLEFAENLDLDPSKYHELSVSVPLLARNIIDRLLNTNRLDALAMVSQDRATGISLADIAGYPSLSLPAGYGPDGAPYGLFLFSRPPAESILLHLANLVEKQGSPFRQPPSFTGYGGAYLAQSTE